MTRSKRAPSLAAKHGPFGQESRAARTPLAAVAAVTAVALLVAACNPFSNPPGPTAPASTESGPTGTATITRAPATPSSTPQLVTTITLVTAIVEPEDATPGGLAWKGVQDAGAKIGASTSLVEPVSNADIPADVNEAAASDLPAVVTIGPEADAAVQAAAAAHPKAQFFEVDVAVPAGSPANVHGIVFDEAEAGYLAGFVAGSFSAGGRVGFVGDVATDVRTANYASGFRNGASQAGTGIGASVAYVSTSDSPDKGRTTAASLVTAGVDVVSARPDLSGIGALREACGRKARLVAVETDAWQIVPDVRSCLIVSVLKRYDIAIENALLRVAAGRPVSTVTLEDVSTGGIAVSDFHVEGPAGFDSQLAGVLSALKNGPTHPTPAPPSGSPIARAAHQLPFESWRLSQAVGRLRASR